MIQMRYFNLFFSQDDYADIWPPHNVQQHAAFAHLLRQGVFTGGYGGCYLNQRGYYEPGHPTPAARLHT